MIFRHPFKHKIQKHNNSYFYTNDATTWFLHSLVVIAVTLSNKYKILYTLSLLLPFKVICDKHFRYSWSLLSALFKTLYFYSLLFLAHYKGYLLAARNLFLLLLFHRNFKPKAHMQSQVRLRKGFSIL